MVGSGWDSWILGQMRGASLRQGGKFIVRFPNPNPNLPNRIGDPNGGPIFTPGITQGTMVNAEWQTITASIPKEVSLMFTNLSRPTDSFVVGVSFDGSKTPVGVVGSTPDSGKRLRWALPPNPNAGEANLYSGKYRVLTLAANLAEVEADTTGTKMWQDTANNLVYVKMMGGFPTAPWSRIVNYTAPFGEDLYQRVGLYIKDASIPN